MNSSKNYESPTGFLDLLFNAMLVYSVLFVLSFILVKPVTKENTMEAKAEFLITTEWRGESPHDVDTYVRDPKNRVVYYNAREVGLLNLDIDDQGTVSDTDTDAEGNKITVNINREIVTVRGILPGEYIVTVHMFAVRDERGANLTPNIDPNGIVGEAPPGGDPAEERDTRVRIKPEKITIRLDKVNPKFKTVKEVSVELEFKGDEKLAFRFTVGKDGQIIDVNQLDYKIATNPENGRFNQGG